MTYQEAARTAIECQNACNLSGVAFSFAEAMQAICDESNRLGKGTDWKNTHPIVTLFLSKLASLNQTDCLCSDCIDSFGTAQNAVQTIGAEAQS